MNDPTSTVEYPLGPPLEFLERVWALNHFLERVSARMDRVLGVTARQRLVVRCVGKFPGMTAGQLATTLRVDPGTGSASLKRLEEKGVIERRRDPRDKRRVTLGLTAKGRALDQPTANTVEHAVDRLLASVGARDIALVMEVLDRLSALLVEELEGDLTEEVVAPRRAGPAGRARRG